jgi:hypothetical protein
MIRFVLIFGLIAVVAVAVWLIFTGDKTNEDALYAQLVKRCLGDDSQAARLIEYERKRSANLDRGELIARALRRLDRDNSR